MIQQMIVLIFVLIFVVPINAQSEDNTLPNPELITVTQLDDLHVSIVGDAGSVSPSQQIVVVNLYTNQRECVEAKNNGSFEISIFGQENMPFIVAYSHVASLDFCTFASSFDDYVVLYSDYKSDSLISFGIGSWTSFGYIPWVAHSTINASEFKQGETLSVQMNFVWEIHPIYNSGWLPEALPMYEMRGNLGLRSLNPDTIVPDDEDNWSRIMTKSGIPLTSNANDVLIETVETSLITYDSEQGILSFTFEFDTQLNALSQGIYIPVFSGELSVSGEDFTPWYYHRHFAFDGTDGITIQMTQKPHPIVFPFTITIGD